MEEGCSDLGESPIGPASSLQGLAPGLKGEAEARAVSSPGNPLKGGSRKGPRRKSKSAPQGKRLRQREEREQGASKPPSSW